MEGPEPQISGNAKVVIEFRAGEMAQERVQLGSRGYTLVLGGVGVRTREVAGSRSPVLGYSPALSAKYSLAVVASDGLLVTHVPDLSSLGLLMEQCKTSQIF